MKFRLLFLVPLLSLPASPLAAQGGGSGSLLRDYLRSLPAQPLSPQERQHVTVMREEEKFARDVYLALAARWALPEFQHIASAEQAHMDLVKFLLDRYQIADPVPGERPGVFTDPRFVQLYPAAVAFGSISPLHAHLVGAVIEDLDIADLDTVWQNLQRGSRNHLRTFFDQLLRQSVVYPGLFITSARLVEIVLSPYENQPVDEHGVPL